MLRVLHLTVGHGDQKDRATPPGRTARKWHNRESYLNLAPETTHETGDTRRLQEQVPCVAGLPSAPASLHLPSRVGSKVHRRVRSTGDSTLW